MDSNFGILVIQIAGVLGPLLLMLLGLFLVFFRLLKSGESPTDHDVKFVGIILFVPMLPFIAIILPNFPPEALITLLGTVAGYVLSNVTRQQDKPDESSEE